MDETIIAPPVPEDQPSDSFLSRAIGIFVSPSRTFQSIARRPDFIAPLIVAMVGGYVLIEAMLQEDRRRTYCPAFAGNERQGGADDAGAA